MPYISKSTDTTNSYVDENTGITTSTTGSPIGLLLSLTYASSLTSGGWSYVSENS